MKRDLYIKMRERMLISGYHLEVDVLDAFFNIVLVYNREGRLIKLV
jgi:hypothetical protein